MRKILISIFITVLLLTVPAFHYAHAVDFGQTTLQGVAGSSGYDTAGGAGQLSRGVGRIIRIALSLVGMIFFALTFYAGFLWMTANGNEEKVTKATDILKTGVIGMIIALSAFSISVFISLKATGIAKTPPSASSAVGGTRATAQCTEGVVGRIGAGVDHATAGVSWFLNNLNCGFGAFGCDASQMEFDNPCDYP